MAQENLLPASYFTDALILKETIQSRDTDSENKVTVKNFCFIINSFRFFYSYKGIIINVFVYTSYKLRQKLNYSISTNHYNIG